MLHNKSTGFCLRSWLSDDILPVYSSAARTAAENEKGE
jgi:hypothetical protein